MIVAIHQPQYLPWLGYFDKMRQADVFCFLDCVQYKKNEWQNRNRIKSASGWQWLTVPVHYRFGQSIGDIRINNRVNWRRKHLQALVTNYRRSPFFKDCIGFFEDLFAREWQRLAELNIAAARGLGRLLGITPRTVLRASTLKLSADPTGRLIDICRAVGADTYLSGPDGGRYMDLERFQQNGLQVVFQQFQHPVYPQLYGSFQPQLSAVDLLFNCGPGSLEVMQQQQRNTRSKDETGKHTGHRRASG